MCLYCPNTIDSPLTIKSELQTDKGPYFGFSVSVINISQKQLKGAVFISGHGYRGISVHESQEGRTGIGS